MKSIVAVLLSTLLCVQTWSVPVSAMPVHEPILYEDTQEKTGGAEDSDTDTGKRQNAKENADVQEKQGTKENADTRKEQDAEGNADDGEEQGAKENADDGEEQGAKENADDGEEIDTQGEVTAPKEEAQGEEQENDGTQADTDGQESGGAGGMAVSAPSAILMEASTGQVIFEKDADTQRPPASVTKVMTLLLIFDALDKGKISLADEVATSEYAASMGGSQVFLEPGEVQTVDTLIKCISVASANDACAPFKYRSQYLLICEG